eukprot:353152-Chlamydomonas_euryale.AAC.2
MQPAARQHHSTTRCPGGRHRARSRGTTPPRRAPHRLPTRLPVVQARSTHDASGTAEGRARTARPAGRRARQRVRAGPRLAGPAACSSSAGRQPSCADCWTPARPGRPERATWRRACWAEAQARAEWCQLAC